MFQLISLAVIAVLTVIDRVTKSLIVSTVRVNGPLELIPGFIRFRYVENTGAAFSSFSDNTKLLSIVTVIILLVCTAVLLSKKIHSKFVNVCLMLIIAGGLGNVIDRISMGYVVDFIEPLFVDFAVFNFADCCITVGAFLLIGYEIFDLVRNGKKEKKQND